MIEPTALSVKEGVIVIDSVEPVSPTTLEELYRLTIKLDVEKFERLPWSVWDFATPFDEKSVTWIGLTTIRLDGLMKVPTDPFIVVSIVLTTPY